MVKTAPLPEAVRLIARILGARRTTQAEVTDVIASVQDAVAAISERSAHDDSVRRPPTEPAPPTDTAGRRTRARRTRQVFAPAAEPTPVSTAPKLMRRDEVGRTPPSPNLQAPPKTRTGLRGIVKWFDPKARVGALRLPGHDDIAIDPDAFERAGVPRLFKGQEIEASIVIEANGNVRLIALSLPGRPETEPVGPIGGLRRHQKQVVIEMKRDAMRRVGARLEAEQILGGRR